MTRKALLLSALTASALVGTAPAGASVRLAAVGGIVNQMHANSTFTGNNFGFSINHGGSNQLVFTGVTGMREFNKAGMPGLNDWASPNGFGETGGAFSSYRPTFSAVGNFFHQTPMVSSAFFAPMSAPPVPTPPVSAPPIPEPATWAMMIIGFGAIGMAMRRRHRVATSFS